MKLLIKPFIYVYFFLMFGCFNQYYFHQKSLSVVPNLVNIPANYSATANLGVLVQGEKAKYYKYKIGQAASTDCTDATGYSNAASISELISENISGVPDGLVKICVIAARAEIGWDTDLATSAEWIKDSVCPNRPYNAGTGTILDPYLICTTDSLVHMAANPSETNHHFKLTSNLNMASVSGFNGIGSEASPFTGEFDGNNKTITGLTIVTSSNTEHIGLFSMLGENSIVKNLTLAAVNINGGATAGAIAARGTGNVTISDLQVSGTITSATSAGGIIGHYLYVAGKTLLVSQANNSAVVTSLDAGGIAGTINGSAVFTDLTNAGAITGTNTSGGIIGVCYGQSGSNCILDLSIANNSGTVSGGVFAGGIAGWLHGNSTVQMIVKKVVNSGTITGSAALSSGGIAGRLHGQIEDSFSTGNISVTMGTSGAGGLIGNVVGNPVRIYRCYATGSVFDNGGSGINTSRCGGLLGWSWGSTEVYDSFSTGNVNCAESGNFVGRFIGLDAGTVISNSSYFSGSTCTNPAGACATVVGNARAAVAHFHNTLNAPVSSWDFTTIWLFPGAALPTLR